MKRNNCILSALFLEFSKATFVHKTESPRIVDEETAERLFGCYKIELNFLVMPFRSKIASIDNSGHVR